MIDFEKKNIMERSIVLKKIRISMGYTMDMISLNRSSISRIENGIIAKNNRNFISYTILKDYSDAFGMTFVEIIFGNEVELENNIKWIFIQTFKLILYRDLESNLHVYNDVDSNQIKLQKAVISIAQYIPRYSFERLEFNKSDSLYMNRIDYDEVSENIWLLCKEEFTNSFKNEVLKSIFINFQYSKMNVKINNWLFTKFIDVVVPKIIKNIQNDKNNKNADKFIKLIKLAFE